MEKTSRHILSAAFLSAALSVSVMSGYAQQDLAAPNYDEALVPQFTLPDPLVAEDGTPILTPEDWQTKRRPELLNLFKEHMFGQFPEADLSKIKTKEISSAVDALGGKATRKEIRIYFNAPEKNPQATVLLYVPNVREADVPVFVMPNFQGNHTISDDPGITAIDVRNRAWDGNKKAEEVRGAVKSRWALDMIISRGYAVATVCYEELELDSSQAFPQGIHSLFTNFDAQSEDYPSAIGAWAWGLSRVLDLLETVPGVDASKAIVAGHSRLGKTALWCGVNDERFAAVISNDSGCGGAALSRRQFGERVDKINRSFPHWFTKKFHEYGAKVNELPIDEHELIALVAPRPIYVASASEDLWADPRGEFLSALYADSVYRLLGTDGIGGVTEQPDVNVPVGATIRYHIRTGVHDVTDFDWEQYLNFADAIFKK